jgi:hypothetical protein
MSYLPANAWEFHLDNMPGFEKSMERVYAWYNREVIDRAPVRFQAHNAFVEQANQAYPSSNVRDRWYDAEFQVETYLKQIEGQTFQGETFPVFWPNLGPEVYAAFFGTELTYGEVTAWATPQVVEWDDIATLKFDKTNAYFRGLETLTQAALERCEGKYIVGYSDFHPGMDAVAAWRDPQQLCFDLIEAPDKVVEMANIANSHYKEAFDHFDAMLKACNQPSVTWLGIPSYGRMHVPSCDFAALISPAWFEEYCLPVILREVEWFDQNVFHVDGRGVLKNIDRIMDIPKVHAIQWVQGMGDDYPIMQWVSVIQHIQKRLPVIIDLSLSDLEPFMEAVHPEGIFLWIATENPEQERDILKRLEKWT